MRGFPLFRQFSRRTGTTPTQGRRQQRPRPAIRRPSLKLSASTKRMIATAAIIFGLIALLFVTAAFWVQWWWFDSVGYRFMLVDRYVAQTATLLLGAAIAGIAFYTNVRLALRRARATDLKPGRAALVTDRLLTFLVIAASVVVAGMFGLAAASNWESWLLWWHSEPFGLNDPIFHRDIGFFVFALPALTQAIDLLLLLTLLVIAAVVVVYTVRLGINLRRIRTAPALMRVHVLSLAGFVFVILAARRFLATYELAYSTRGAVFGAGYTDAQVQRPVNYLLAVVALLIGVLLVANAFVRRTRLLIGAIVGWGILYVALSLIVPAAVQQTVVEPSELQRERPYIENHI